MLPWKNIAQATNEDILFADQIKLADAALIPNCKGLALNRLALFSPLSLHLRAAGVRMLIGKGDSGALKSGDMAQLPYPEGPLKIKSSMAPASRKKVTRKTTAS